MTILCVLLQPKALFLSWIWSPGAVDTNSHDTTNKTEDNDIILDDDDDDLQSPAHGMKPRKILLQVVKKGVSGKSRGYAWKRSGLRLCSQPGLLQGILIQLGDSHL